MAISPKEAAYLSECLRLLYKHVGVEDVWIDNEQDWEWMNDLHERLKELGATD